MSDQPLPVVDDQRKLRWESERQLKALVEPGLKFRTEEGDDLGVDGTLEVIDGTSATNLRAQIQLKGMRSPKRRKSGAVPLRVPTSNVHYLLNHQPAAYLLYLGDTQRFLVRWVDDLMVELQRREPQWDQGKHVTFPLSEELTAGDLARFTAELVRRARLGRQIQLEVARAAHSISGSKIIVDSIDLSVMSEAEVVSCLEEDGLNLCSQGHASAILERLSALTEQTRRRPKLRLLLAFAHSKLGRHFDVMVHTATPPDPSLTADERVLGELIRFGAERMLGRRSQESYIEAIDSLACEAPESLLAAQMRLEALKGRAATASGPEIQTLASDLERCITRIRDDSSAPVALHFRAMATALEVEGYEISRTWSDGLSRAGLAQVLGMSDLAAGGAIRARRADAAFSDWVRRVDELAAADLAKADPPIAAHLVWLKVWMVFGHVQTLSLRGELAQIAPGWRDRLPGFVLELDLAARAFQDAQMSDDRVFCLLLRGEIVHFLGDAEAAAKIAAETLPIARVVGRPEFIERLALLERGTSKLAEYATSMSSEAVDGVSLAKADDNEIERLAEDLTRRLGLSAECLPRIRADYMLEREVERDRFRHCRHVDLESGSTVPPSVASRFTVDPLHFGVCRLHHHRSAIPLSDGEAVRSAFKAAFCAGCSDRAPLDIFNGLF